MIVVAGLLTLTIVGIPLAVVYLVRKAVLTQACVVEDLRATPALRRSSELVSGHGPRVLAIAALVNVTAFLLGPIVGVSVLFLTSSSLAFINLISSLVYASSCRTPRSRSRCSSTISGAAGPVRNRRWRRLHPERAMTRLLRREMLHPNAQSLTKGVTR